MKFSLLMAMALLTSTSTAAEVDRIDLSGQWRFALDPDSNITPDSVCFSDSILLPGTTDTRHKGHITPESDITTRLSRRNTYKGRAWYERDIVIPPDWRSKNIFLTLERTKPSEVYIDGVYADCNDDISTPQQYDLTSLLTPGCSHTISIMIDNSRGIPEQLYASSHAFSEDTQTNWNGIIGEITLSTMPFSQPKQPVADSIHKAFRNFEIRGKHFFADGHPVYLRGRHDACVWPATGHTPMDVESWRRYFQVCSDYGINHVRFHSWCPPEAAFTAADDAGIVLQPELPFWGDFNSSDTTLMNFLHKEGVNILKHYGHHPSFRLMALGNELWGDIDMMQRFVNDFRSISPDKFFTYGSNYYLGYQGVKPGMDFFVTCRVGGEEWGSFNSHTRASFSFADAADGGMINHFRPSTSLTFESGCQASPIPVIAHETGQYQIYPDYSTLHKYDSSVLNPCNLKVFQDRLRKAGMEKQAVDFLRASGKWAVELYKRDIEMCLLTPDMAGFQLLDIQDYPGQGSAFIGILDAFLEPKGLVTPEEWRGWCNEVVPLLSTDSLCLTLSSGLNANIKIANYGPKSLHDKTLRWFVGGQEGELKIPEGYGLIDLGSIHVDLSSVPAPSQISLKLDIPGTDYSNSYRLWVYPDSTDFTPLSTGIIQADKLSADVIKRLVHGAKVLLTPGESEITVGGLFATDYWNYRMFKTISENNGKPVSPGTLGLLINNDHPLFESFPTDAHTDWQWWPIVNYSHPMILDNAPSDYLPIVQVIDNVERNHRLGLIFEFAVGKGKLLVAMTDLKSASQYPEGRQFAGAVLSYMQSDHFTPSSSITPEQLLRLMTTKVNDTELEKLFNITTY